MERRYKINNLKPAIYTPSEVPQDYWDFAEKYGTIYQSKSYLECLAANNAKCLVVVVYEENVIAGGAVITLGRSILGIVANASTYFGPVVKNHAIVDEVLMCISQSLKRTALFFSVTVFPEHLNELLKNKIISRWNKEEVEFLFWDISSELEDMWRKLPKGKKSGVNRARREGIIIKEIETPEQIEQFFEVYSMSMRKSGLDPGSIQYYKNLIMLLRPAGLAAGFLALHPQKQQPVAGRMILLGNHHDATFFSSGHNPRYRKLRGADLLVWHCIEFLKSKGFTVVDFVGLPKGNSARAKGIRHFKTAWAGSNGKAYPSFILTCSNYRLNRRLVLSILNFLKAIMKFASKVFKFRR